MTVKLRKKDLILLIACLALTLSGLLITSTLASAYQAADKTPLKNILKNKSSHFEGLKLSPIADSRNYIIKYLFVNIYSHAINTRTTDPDSAISERNLKKLINELIAKDLAAFANNIMAVVSVSDQDGSMRLDNLRIISGNEIQKYKDIGYLIDSEQGYRYKISSKLLYTYKEGPNQRRQICIIIQKISLVNQ